MVAQYNLFWSMEQWLGCDVRRESNVAIPIMDASSG